MENSRSSDSVISGEAEKNGHMGARAINYQVLSTYNWPGSEYGEVVL